ncbi:tRNA pseudouridine synthase-like 1 isoform X5 [Gymnogyps californianus]|uniref:tRNA pseudouridine synthase-like 1 isoform X5 n=1 Tax=Gymnogyps californianus TaxID=33616 RepID=UPI0021C721C1|nr:tRNA pseudouridine synthase-like 1 isoform X5 [Gymnogyps californianus]XP_050765527.1 tRNA pseudouridine synthase-like 1 isoform X5 [Gymnogyps californianus]
MVSPPTRYLVFFQYFGTKYSGVMETSNDQSMVGVQNYLEKAAQNLKPIVPIKFYISSRTDAGVHALCNSAHLDIQRPPGKPAFNEKQLICSLNYHLKPEPIRILNAYRVTNSFHARFSALSRTYVYRLLMGCTHYSEIPVFEKDLCWAPAGGYLNVPAMQDAAQFLLGTHDFSTFRSLNSETPFRSPVRTILQADIRPSSGFLSHHYEHRGLEFWEVKFRSRSFLYRQSWCYVCVTHTGTQHQRGPKNGWGSSCSWPGKVNTSSYKGVTGDKRFTGFSTKCHGSAIWTLSKISGI